MTSPSNWGYMPVNDAPGIKNPIERSTYEVGGVIPACAWIRVSQRQFYFVSRLIGHCHVTHYDYAAGGIIVSIGCLRRGKRGSRGQSGHDPKLQCLKAYCTIQSKEVDGFERCPTQPKLKSL